MKVALIHPWLVTMGGAEKVLEQLCLLFPDADIFTHALNVNVLSPVLRRHVIKTTFIQQLPFARRRYRSYLPLMPMALEQLDLQEYDLIISCEYAPAKGIIASPDAVHICYCHTPMRYLWNMYSEHWRRGGMVSRLLLPPITHYLRLWDETTANRVDHFLANSHNTAKRVSRYFNKHATVVYPPVNGQAFVPSGSHDGFYLTIGRLVPYKRTDLAVKAFNRLGLPLVVIGKGPELQRLTRLAKPNIKFLGHQPDAALSEYYRRCKGLIFPGEEDFGIVPLEAMASGKPVIGFARGGALETIVHGRTGILFGEQSVDALCEAVLDLERGRYDFVPATIAAHANRFGEARFRAEMRREIDKAIAERHPRENRETAALAGMLADRAIPEGVHLVSPLTVGR